MIAVTRHRVNVIITVLALGLAITVFGSVVARAFAFEFLVVDGISMIPTIMLKDRILVSRLAYRFQKPQIGDIVAFEMGSRTIVKRIVGVPGDIIEFEKDTLRRNGEAVENETYIARYPRYLERRRYRPRRVKDRHVFVMGDNRLLSWDSRDFGTVSYQDIIGKALFIYSPRKRMRKLG